MAHPVTAPVPVVRIRAPHRSLAAALGVAKRSAAAALAPHTSSVRRLADMPLAVIGTGLIDFSAFHVTHAVGWLVTGISLWVVEHLIADEDTNGTA